MTIEKASAIGALDSDALRSGRVSGAKLLRTMAMQSNLQRELPTVMSNVAIDATFDPGAAETPGGYPTEMALDTRFRLFLPWLCPRRPDWTEAAVRAQVFAPAGVSVSMDFRDGNGSRGVITFEGTGNRQTVTGTIELEPDGSIVQRLELWLRGAAGAALANATTIGGPNTLSWTISPPRVQTSYRYLETGGNAYNESFMETGRYRVVGVDPTGTDAWSRTVERSTPDRLYYAEPITGFEASAINQAGGSFEIRTAPQMALFNLNLTGGSP